MLLIVGLIFQIDVPTRRARLPNGNVAHRLVARHYYSYHFGSPSTSIELFGIVFNHGIPESGQPYRNIDSVAHS